MAFEKKVYLQSFSDHVDLCISSAIKNIGCSGPSEVKFHFGFDNLYEEALEHGHVKSLGGRLLKPNQLKDLSIDQVAKYTFIDGTVPIWINLYFEGICNDIAVIRVVASKELTGDDSKLYNMPEGTKQFRIMRCVEN